MISTSLTAAVSAAISATNGNNSNDENSDNQESNNSNDENSDSEEEDEPIIIDRDTAPSNNLSCSACGSSEPRYTTKSNRKKIPLGVWLKSPDRMSRYLCGGCYRTITNHKQQGGYDFFDVSKKEIHPMRLSEEMPGCIDPVKKEYRVDRIVGHSFQTLYRVRWEGYDSDDDTFVQRNDISEDLVSTYDVDHRIPVLESKIQRVVRTHKPAKKRKINKK